MLKVDAIKNQLTIDANDVIRWNGAAIDRPTMRQYLDQSRTPPTEPELHSSPRPKRAILPWTK